MKNGDRWHFDEGPSPIDRIASVIRVIVYLAGIIAVVLVASGFIPVKF